MKKLFSQKNLIRAGALILAALVLAAGLEWLVRKTLAPVYLDQKVEFASGPAPSLTDGSVVYENGRPVMKEERNLLRFLMAFVLQLSVLILLFPLGLGKRMSQALARSLRQAAETLRKEKKRNALLLGGFLLTSAAVFFVGRLWIRANFQRENWMVDLLCGCSGVCAGVLVTFRRTVAKKPEAIFLILVLIFGGVVSWVLPAASGVSMDDGFHYQHAMNYSMLGQARFTKADWDLMQKDNPRDYEIGHWEENREKLDEKNRGGAVYVTLGFHLSPKEYWMSTHGLGLFLGRLLRLRYRDIWCLGRFSGLAVYALLGYFAIRRLKSGKMVAALAWMIPSAVSLAVNYSYDGGVIAGIWLSVTYWIAQWQEPEKKLTNGDAAVMILGVFIACFAKQIYFPVYLLFLFLPRSKFRNRRHRRLFTAAVLAAMVLVMANILLPLGASGGQADTRAEGNVNTFGQILFILQHPAEYAGILWRFIEEYLDLGGMDGPLLNFGYQGNGNNVILCMLILAAAAFTDQREEGLQPRGSVRLLGQALLFGTLCLMATSMYAWFSEVGQSVIGGMQPRYLIPLIYPSLALMGSNRIRNHAEGSVYNGILFAGMTYVCMTGIFFSCIEYYH